MMPAHQYPGATGVLASLVRVVNGLLQGRANVTGIGTVTGSTGTATVVDPRCHPDSVVVVSPQLAGVVVTVLAYRKGEFDVTWDHVSHGASVPVRYVILG